MLFDSNIKKDIFWLVKNVQVVRLEVKKLSVIYFLINVEQKFCSLIYFKVFSKVFIQQF